jgi:O-antigen/teichoic acid export membrane protein
VTLGYAAFLIALGVHRSLLVDPLLTRIATATRSTGEALRAAVSVTVLGGALVSALALAVGFAATGAAARGMLVFSPWFAPALTHALLRAWLYRNGRGTIATISSAVWLITMLAAVGAGLQSSDWQITAAWGLGACAALLAAGAGTAGLGLSAPRGAATWFLQEALRVGFWRTASGIVFSAATYVRVAGMSSILGPSAVGGYRAIETVFAPTSLIGPALGNPGIPAMRDAVERRSAASWALALKISLLSTGLVLAFVVPVTLARDLVFDLFGPGFSEYEFLILPIAVGALVGGMGTGFSILLLAARRMDELALLVFVNSVLTLAFALPLAALFGLEAAAWGIVLAAVPPFVMVVVIARRVAQGFRGPDGVDVGMVETTLTPLADRARWW